MAGHGESADRDFFGGPDFERAFVGKSKTGRPKRRVNVSSASRLMIALGRAPNELPGC